MDIADATSAAADASTGGFGSDTSASGGGDPFDYSSFYDQYQYAGSTPDPEGMSLAVENVLRDYQDRFGGSGDLAGLGVTFNTPINIDAPPAPVASGAAPTPSYTTTEGDYGQNIFSILDQGITGMQTGTSGRGQLDALSAAGLGNMPGMNPNNPTQTVDQLINSYRANNFLEKYAPTIFGAATGFGPHLNAIRMGADVLSGKTTPGQALTGLAAGLIGAKTGIPAGVLEGIFTNNPGRIAGAGAQAGLGAIVNALTKDPVARAMADVTLGSALNRNVSESVGGSSKKGGGLPEILDSGLGNLGRLFSGTGTPSQRSASTDNTYSDAGNNADTYAVTSAIEKAAQEYKPPTQKREMVAGRYGPIMNYDFGA